MNYLICDTTSEALTVIVIKGEEEFVHFNSNSGRHNSELITVIDRLLRDSELTINDIDVFSAVTGPGSFTGIRIGITVMNSFVDVTNKKLIGLNSFEILSYGYDNVITVIDAKNNNYYGAEFTNGRISRMGDYRQADLDLNCLNKVYKKNIDYSKAIINIVKAKAERGQFLKRLEPLYLKDSQAERELVKKNYHITKMTDAHLEQVMNIETATFHTPWTLDMYRETFNNLNSYSIVLESDSEVVGYASILQIYDEMHIMKIAVKNNMRRQGYGDLLFSHIIDKTVTTDAKQITLEVRVSNIAAQTLYAKYGFKCIGLRKKYYEMKEDALIYTLELGR